MTDVQAKKLKKTFIELFIKNSKKKGSGWDILDLVIEGVEPKC